MLHAEHGRHFIQTNKLILKPIETLSVTQFPSQPDISISQESSEAYHGVPAGLHLVLLQKTHQNHLHDHHSEAHPHTVPWAEAKGHVGIGVDVLPVVLTEPEKHNRNTYPQVCLLCLLHNGRKV